MRFAPNFGESDATADPTPMFSPMTAPRREGFYLDLNKSYTDSPAMCQGTGSEGVHLTDGIGLPRSLFGESSNAHRVFNNTSSMQ
jgi:hypothetical protein